MTDLADRLRTTLNRYAEQVDTTPPPLATLAPTPTRPPRRPRTPVVAAAVALTVLAGGTAVAASVFDFSVNVFAEPDGSTMGGIENSDLFAPGAPFHCTGLFDLTPRKAEDVVESRGFDATWQYDGRVWPENKTPPDTAYVDEVVLLDDQTARLIATPDRRPVRPDRGCPDE